MKLKRYNSDGLKSKLLINKVLIIVISVLLVSCIGCVVFFFVQSNKAGKEKQYYSQTGNQPDSTSQESSSETSSDSSNNSSGANNDDIILTEDYSEWNKKCSPELILVNANNKLPESYKISLSDYCGVQVNSIIYVPLNKMIETARLEANVNLWLSSSYRDIDVQTALFQREVNDKLAQGYPQQKAESLAAKEVARPGYSEHNTGLAIDLNGVNNNFKDTAEYKWLLDNSYKFGFILRYPEEKKDLTGIIYEPWHFRFVGVDVATQIKNENICFEEYVSMMK